MSEALASQMPKVETKGGIVAYLNLDGAVAAAEFYARAFGAVVVAQYPPDAQGRTMHIHLHLNDASLMLSDVFTDHGFEKQSPAGFSLMLTVVDINAWWTRAIAAGCTERTPPQKMFWGDTFGEAVDPFGVVWSLNQPA